jgi:hypothetical protein
LYKLIKVLGMMTVLFASVDRASAFSFEAAGSSEFYTYTNDSTFSVTLENVLLFDGTSPTGIGQSFAPAPLSAGQSVTEVLSGLTAGDTYQTSPIAVSQGTPTKFSESVSAVPLPAGFPLFAMGLIALGSLGYFGTRKKDDGKSALVTA